MASKYHEGKVHNTGVRTLNRKLKVFEIAERSANIESVSDQVSQSESKGDRMSPSGAK